MTEWGPSGVQRKAVPLGFENRRNQRRLPGGSDTGEPFNPGMQLLGSSPPSTKTCRWFKDQGWVLAPSSANLPVPQGPGAED